MQRRTFLHSTGISLVGLKLGLLTGCGQSDQSDSGTSIPSDDPRQALNDLAANLEGVSFTGPVCAAMGLGDNPLELLLSRLQGHDAATIDLALAAIMASDIAAGRTVDIDGWQLAESECLLLAGAARLQGLQGAQRAEVGELLFEDFAQIENWGPSETIEGEIFNPIGNGRGGFWLRVTNPVPAATKLMLDGVELATHFQPGVVTASLEPAYMDEVIAEPGLHELMLVDRATQRAQKIGFLTVRERPPLAVLDDGTKSTVFCEVESWGPHQANQGQAFNEQPDGSAAFWLRIGCAPKSASLRIDGKDLPTTVRPGMVTARMPEYGELLAGDYKIEIHDPVSAEMLQVGIFRVN